MGSSSSDEEEKHVKEPTMGTDSSKPEEKQFKESQPKKAKVSSQKS